MMSEAKAYRGSCHCGAVSFTVETDLAQPFDCNCSRCRRVASVMIAAPASAFTLHSGADMLVRYQFNKHVIEHLFCRQCGIQSFSRGTNADGSAGVVVNLGCLEGAPVPERQAVFRYDGANA